MANETASEKARGRKQTKLGVVTSAKMQKTIVVKVTRLVQHPLYTRVVRLSKKFYAHDESGEARTGDTVRIEIDGLGRLQIAQRGASQRGHGGRHFRARRLNGERRPRRCKITKWKAQGDGTPH